MKWIIRRNSAVSCFIHDNKILSIVKINFYEQKQLIVTLMNLEGKMRGELFISLIYVMEIKSFLIITPGGDLQLQPC